jgi:hypothetical protein
METEKLSDVLPKDFHIEYRDTKAFEFKDVEVLSEHDSRQEPWPGKQKHVCFWWKLANGFCIGWNENPATGWSFPVIKTGP